MTNLSYVGAGGLNLPTWLGCIEAFDSLAIRIPQSGVKPDTLGHGPSNSYLNSQKQKDLQYLLALAINQTRLAPLRFCIVITTDVPDKLEQRSAMVLCQLNAPTLGHMKPDRTAG